MNHDFFFFILGFRLLQSNFGYCISYTLVKNVSLNNKQKGMYMCITSLFSLKITKTNNFIINMFLHDVKININKKWFKKFYQRH